MGDNRVITLSDSDASHTITLHPISQSRRVCCLLLTSDFDSTAMRDVPARLS